MSDHGKVYQNVIEILTRNRNIVTSGEERIKTVEIVERIYKKAHKLKQNYEKEYNKNRISLYCWRAF